MPRINLSRVIQSPARRQSFQVKRISGTWTNGRFVTTESTLTLSGQISPIKPKELAQLPQGDTVHGGIVIHTTAPLYVTALNQSTQTEGQLSDEIIWKGERWKILGVQNYSDYGYYRAVATRKLGA